MELSILKLKSPRMRALHNSGLHSNRFAFDHELACGTISPTSPHASSPPSPRWGSSMTEDDMCTIFDQHRAAIPFKWEETPGTPRGMRIVKDEGSSSSGEEQDTSSDTISRSSSSGNSSSDKAESFRSTHDPKPDSEEFCFSLSGEPIPATSDGSKHADELFSKGQLLPLKPPPRMQSIKHLMALDADDRSFSFTSLSRQSLIGSTSPKKARRSFRKDGLKALPFLASPRKEHHDEHMNMIMLGFEEWPKMAHEQESGRRASVSFSFRKKHDEMDHSMDSIFSAHSVTTGGRRPLTSVSSRGLADGYNFRNRFFPTYDSDCDSDVEFEGNVDYSETSRSIPEVEEEKEPEQKKALKHLVADDHSDSAKANRKRYALRRLSRFFRSNRNKPARTSSVSPAPPRKMSSASSPALGQNHGEHKMKRIPQQQTRSPILQMCFSNSIGQALLRNVKQIRSFEFHSHRSVAVK